MHKLSTGADSTLKSYLELCLFFFGEDSAAVAYLKELIERKGEDHEVLQDENQVRMLLTAMHVRQTKPGATGDFSDGKIEKSDQGELNFLILTDKENGILTIEFGAEVSWIGMNKQEALGLSEIIKSRAEFLP